MAHDTPWLRHILGFAIVLLVLLVFQQVIRGELTPEIAFAGALGYVIVSELVRRYRDRQDGPTGD